MSPIAHKRVVQLIRGQKASDGAGVQLIRIIGGRELSMLDPFLLLDAFGSDRPDEYLAGFPAHPHRGFETVTYMLAGRMRHRDSTGSEGVIGPGDVQWMTAGRGVIHSEMPEQEEGLMSGFQLWINLPASHKMTEPAYQEIPAGDIPIELIEGGGRIKVVAGCTDGGTQGPIRNELTSPLFLDIQLNAGSRLTQSVPEGHSAFIYIFEGEVSVGSPPQRVTFGHLGVLGSGETVVLSTSAGPCRLLLIAGRALREPVARGGPFVMNTREEIEQAFSDYQSGRF